MESHFIVKRPIVTEKSLFGKERNEYSFEVDKRANKPAIRKAIEELFNVKVIDIRTSTLKPQMKFRRGRKYMTSTFKKATVKLSSENKIEYN